jgi:hypothetical protein
MVASSTACRKQNEATSWVSFFFVISLLFSLEPARAWQEASTSWTDPKPEVRDRIERATHEQWIGFIQTSARALLGEGWGEEIGEMPSKDLPNQQRVRWLAERIEQWTQSRSFAQTQAKAWVVDRCGGEFDGNEIWDFRLHDDWIRNSISRNESFLTFTQSQLAGDVMFDGLEAKLGTTAWFRCGNCPQTADEPRSSRGRPLRIHSSPTLDELPENLKWTSLSCLPWLYCDASESQRMRLLDLEASMVSVLKTEQRDWERLLRDPAVARWYQSQSGWPTPNPADRTFDLSEQRAMPTVEESMGDSHSSFAITNPWRYVEPWTLVLEFEVRNDNAIGSETSLVLVRQRSAHSDPSMLGKTCSIEWDDGKICVRLIHSLPHSYLAIETEPIFQKAGVYSLAIVYDGFPSAHTVRVWGDGRWLPVRSMHEALVRDVASDESQVLEVIGSSDGSLVRVTQMESYRSALSAFELEGWRQAAAWKEWDACSEDEQLGAREHYARRVDLQWRYQRESLSFYANSFASVLSKVGMVPVADSDSRELLAIPEPFASAIGTLEKVQDLSPVRRQALARECAENAAVSLAKNEVVRQWGRMLAAVGAGEQVRMFDEDLMLLDYARRWAGKWDRQDLVRSMVFSEGWVVTALDSPP